MNLTMKECLINSIRIVDEVEKETKFLFNNKSDAVLRLSISGYIQHNGNGNGKSNGNGKDVDSNGKDVPATEKQMAFLRKHGGKGIILANINKAKAGELIKDISEGWKK